MRKPTKTSLRNKLDRVFSQLIRSRGKCERTGYGCTDGRKHTLQTAHIFSRTYNATRWDIDNALCLCASCHFFFHKNPVLFGEFVEKIYGKEKFDLLKEARNQVSKYSIEDLQIKLKVLEEMIKELK